MSDRWSEAFERALDEARRKDRAPDASGPAPRRRPRLPAGVPLGSEPGSGGEMRFGLALGWTDEPADWSVAAQAQPCETAHPSGDASGEIAAQLGLDGPLTLDQLASRWRQFVWRNHPDRQPLEARERANRRVAIANMLYERARRELVSRKSGPVRIP